MEVEREIDLELELQTWKGDRFVVLDSTTNVEKWVWGWVPDSVPI